MGRVIISSRCILLLERQIKYHTANFSNFIDTSKKKKHFKKSQALRLTQKCY